MLPETVGQLFVGGMEQAFSCMKVVNISFYFLVFLNQQSFLSYFVGSLQNLCEIK